jgi:RNA polymerase sigma factor (sigma-70 family)
MKLENISIEAFRAGDHEVFKQVFNDMFPYLKFWLLRKFPNVNVMDVEDCLSEAFYKLFTYRQRIRDIDHIKQVLFLVCKHRVIDRWRLNVRTSPIVYDVLDEDDPLDEERWARTINLQVAATIEDSEDESGIEYLRKRMYYFIDRLPKMRRIVILLTIQGWPAKKIAAKLGLSPQTVNNHRNKAMKFIESRIPEARGRRKILCVK